VEFIFDAECVSQKKERKLSFQQQVMKRILTGDRIIYARQGKILKRILEEFPDRDFWLNVNFGNSISSFEYFNTYYGRKLLEKKYFEFHYKTVETEKDEEYNLSDKKVGNDYNIVKKNNLRDFLNG
jgi:hypothetical protein